VPAYDAAAADPWHWQPHPEVWLVIAVVLGLGLYVTRVIAPKVPASRLDGKPAVSRRQKAWFVGGVALLWVAADWPLHDLAEQQLYSLHMVQHTLLTLIIPPMFLLSMPTWLVRLAMPHGSRSWAVISRLAKPVPAAVIFNGLVLASHWTAVVNTSVQVAPVHYSVHVVLVASAFLMWTPVCGPWPELRLGPAGACVYLFAQSVLPTVPGAFLTLSESPVYGVYDHLPRLWGISVLDDQQFAGLIMKLGESVYLWTLIIIIFFRWALAQERSDRRHNLVRIEDGVVVRLRDEDAVVAEAEAITRA
jgi:putative membrane protein